jgi:hypothetical protein
MKAHSQKNTLLKAAEANAASKVFKRVFFLPPQKKNELKTQTHGASSDRHRLECKSL